MALPEIIDWDNKKWEVIAKCSGERVDDHTKLKKIYGCDMVLKNSQNIFFMLNEIIDSEFDEI